MLITYLGHAGFCVETEASIIVMDPWLSPTGAFDAAWYQYPKNHHMGDYIRNLFATSKKDKYIYISHEHKDHFDIKFLESLKNRDFKIILAKFHRPVVKPALEKKQYQCKEIISLNNDETLQLKDGSITLFTVDAELECDSAILLKVAGKSFLNLNDCKLHEALGAITEEHGKIDIFAVQFSGAIWHPTCYKMPQSQYEEISLSKMLVKFEVNARALKLLQPSIYLPSAGPPCFLDPMLIEKNFEKINIFPRAPKFIEYLDEHCKGLATKWPEIMPGDVLDVEKLKFVKLSSERIKDSDFESYVRSYAKEYTEFFQQRNLENQKVDPQQVFLELSHDLTMKLNALKLVKDEIDKSVYWRLSDYPDAMYKINFKEKVLTTVQKIEDPDNFYLIESPAWQVKKVLNGEIDWPDFALTFRVELSRKPDIYYTLIHGFLTLDASALPRFFELLEQYHAKKERITIEFEGKPYSILRYCPHQGGDLKSGWIEGNYFVCPRHRWKFDLTNYGKCVYNNETIDAICLEEQQK